jgi:hypothetical protein
MFFAAWRRFSRNLAFSRPMGRAARRSAAVTIGMECLEPRLLLAANLFVATTGNDAAGTGSAAAPFATLDGALRVAQPGDTILVHGGHYAGGVRVGTPHLTIKSYPGETAVFTASVQDPHVQAALRFAPEASGCTLEGVELIGGYDYGLFFMTDWEQGSGPQPSANHELVVNCKIHDTGRDGVKVTPFCDYVTIRGCEIFNTGRRDPTNADGIDDVNADRLVVQDCSIHDVPTNGLYAKGGATAVVIERNFIAHCGKAGVGVGVRYRRHLFRHGGQPELLREHQRRGAEQHHHRYGLRGDQLQCRP